MFDCPYRFGQHFDRTGTSFLSLCCVVIKSDTYAFINRDFGLFWTVVKKNRFFFFPFMWHHSATKVYRQSDWGDNDIIYSKSNCNHSTCPSNMNYKCGTFWHGRTTAVKGTHNCTTPYSPFADNKHNCHDDTALQYCDVKKNTWLPPNSGRCKDDAFCIWAPSCGCPSSYGW